MKFAEPVYRPSMEADSLLLPVTQSCNWNKCNFCYRLKDYPFLVATPDDLAQEILSQKVFYDGIHCLNPLHFRFQTSDKAARSQALAQIERVLSSYTDEELEKAINRRQM